MSKNIKSPTGLSQAKNNHTGFIGSLPSLPSPQSVKEIILPRSLDVNISFEIKYRR